MRFIKWQSDEKRLDFPEDDAAEGFYGSCSGRARGFERRQIARMVYRAITSQKIENSFGAVSAI
jgi:hypothetical protein